MVHAQGRVLYVRRILHASPRSLTLDGRWTSWSKLASAGGALPTAQLASLWNGVQLGVELCVFECEGGLTRLQFFRLEETRAPPALACEASATTGALREAGSSAYPGR